MCHHVYGTCVGRGSWLIYVLLLVCFIMKMGAGVSGCRNDDESARYYRATEPLLPTTGLMRVPCGGCQVFNNCCSSLDDVAGSAVNPRKCVYMKEWMS